MRKGVRAVVFDWAGTTVDDGCLAPVEAFVEALAARGVEVDGSAVRGPMGHAKRDHLAAVLSLPAVAAQWAGLTGREPSEADLDAVYEDVERRMTAAALQRADVIPGTLEAIAALRTWGVRIGSCTGYPRALMAELAAAAAARGYAPDAVVTPDDVPRGRPAPYMCYLNAVRLDVHPLGHMVKVGDTVVDVLEGRAAGMWSVGTLRGGSEVGLGPEARAALGAAELEERLGAARERFFEAGAHYVVESIADVPEVIARIDTRIASGDSPAGAGSPGRPVPSVRPGPRGV